MSNFWSNLLSAIIGAAILAAIPAIWSLFGTSQIYVSYNWINVPTPSQIVNGARSMSGDPKLTPFLQTEDAQKFADRFASSSEMQIIQLDVVNESNAKSKDIELSIEKSVVAFVGDGSGYSSKYKTVPVDERGTIKIPSLNPGEKTHLNIAADGYTFRDPKVLALSDGMRIPVYATFISEDWFGKTTFANQHGTFTYCIVCVIVLVGALCFISVPFVVLIQTNIDFAAKHTAAKDLVRWQKVIDRAKQLDPVKAASLQIASLQSPSGPLPPVNPAP